MTTLRPPPAGPPLVPVTATPGVTAATLVWRRRAQLWMTVLAKARFAIVAGEEMRPIAATRVNASEVYGGGDPRRSIVAASELAPVLSRVDVTFVGSAYSREPAPRKRVSLRIERGSSVLLSKSIDAIGDRGSPDGEPEPFTRMPLVYERAEGGIGYRENPVGTGHGGGRPPNLLPVHAEAPRPTGFAPISWGWAARKQWLGGPARPSFDHPIVELPDGLDFAFFQTASPDQQLGDLTGDEVIVLDGLLPGGEVVTSRLPRVAGRARLLSRSSDFEIDLRLDTVSIDGDAGHCTLLFRRAIPLPTGRVPTEARALVHVSTHGEPARWPSVENLAASPPSRAQPPAPLDQTQSLSRPGAQLSPHETHLLQDAAAPSLRAPFRVARPAAATESTRPPVPGAPWSEAGEAVLQPQPDGLRSTWKIDSEGEAQPAARPETPAARPPTDVSETGRQEAPRASVPPPSPRVQSQPPPPTYPSETAPEPKRPAIATPPEPVARTPKPNLYARFVKKLK